MFLSPLNFVIMAHGVSPKMAIPLEPVDDLD
jgi:hypothetical protein